MYTPFTHLRDWTHLCVDLHQIAVGGGGGGRAAPVPVPDGTASPSGTVQQRRIATPYGERLCRVFVPDHPATRARVIVMLHGCGQDAMDFARGTRMNDLAADFGAYVLWPEQSSAANGLRCWNWHEPENQQDDEGEAALLMALTDRMIADEGLTDPDLFVAGLSAGGAMAAVMAAMFPQRLRAVGIHSGLPYAAAATLSQALSVMRQGAQPSAATGVPMIVFHGDADDTVAPANGAALATPIEGDTVSGGAPGQLGWTRRAGLAGEYWLIHGLGHCWSGGDASGTFTDPRGPDASAEMIRFFGEHLRR